MSQQKANLPNLSSAGRASKRQSGQIQRTGLSPKVGALGRQEGSFFKKARASCMDRTGAKSVPVPWGQWSEECASPLGTNCTVTDTSENSHSSGPPSRYTPLSVSLSARQSPLPAIVYRASCKSLGKSFYDLWTHNGDNRGARALKSQQPQPGGIQEA